MYYHYGNTYYKHFIFIILLTFVNRKCKSCKIFVITICNFVNYTLRNSNYRKSFIRSRTCGTCYTLSTLSTLSALSTLSTLSTLNTLWTSVSC